MGGSHNTHPPPSSLSPPPLLKDWAKFAPGPWAKQKFSPAPSAPIHLDQNFSSVPLKAQQHSGRGGGALDPLTPPQTQPPPPKTHPPTHPPTPLIRSPDRGRKGYTPISCCGNSVRSPVLGPICLSL